MNTLDKINKINKKTYNELAEEYDKKWKNYLDAESSALFYFIKELRKSAKKELLILDVGCGVGLLSKILSEKGFQVKGIDFSGEMIKYAKINAPLARFKKIDFFAYSSKEKYDGIVLSSFIHLFPKEEMSNILKKITSLLLPEGVVFIATTYHETPSQGFKTKAGFAKKLQRYRKNWTAEELIKMLENENFEIIDKRNDFFEPENKKWINILAIQKH
ncbi:MAG: methyltransferase domain-containing protein [Candidatus Nanoarchaeia archaeon]|jgi:2-polyprenyl-3-methyl-5-hydroxy-6-metoxy-1,4-benzoquinol methylase